MDGSVSVALLPPTPHPISKHIKWMKQDIFAKDFWGVLDLVNFGCLYRAGVNTSIVMLGLYLVSLIFGKNCRKIYENTLGPESI